MKEILLTNSFIIIAYFYVLKSKKSIKKRPLQVFKCLLAQIFYEINYSITTFLVLCNFNLKEVILSLFCHVSI